MRLDYLGLQAFLSIAERGSFRKAAAHLNLSQTAISHRMRKFEEEVGIKLIARTTREVTLTRGDIACLPAFAVHYLPPILSRFRKTHPNVEVRIFETPSAAIAELVGSGDVEFGLSVIQANRWDLEVETITEAQLVLACPYDHALANKRSVSWKEL